LKLELASYLGRRVEQLFPEDEYPKEEADAQLRK
jgi:hypothetical protein